MEDLPIGKSSIGILGVRHDYHEDDDHGDHHHDHHVYANDDKDCFDHLRHMLSGNPLIIIMRMFMTMLIMIIIERMMICRRRMGECEIIVEKRIL